VEVAAVVLEAVAVTESETGVSAAVVVPAVVVLAAAPVALVDLVPDRAAAVVHQAWVGSAVAVAVAVALAAAEVAVVAASAAAVEVAAVAAVVVEVAAEVGGKEP
jgi:hypothetical protein